MSHFTLPASLLGNLDAIELQSELARSDGRVLRFLMLNDHGIKHLGDDERIGRHWTTNASGMSFDALHIPAEADNTWKTYEVTGKIDDLEVVDLDRTLTQRREIPWEREVVLRGDAEVTIISIHLYDEQNRRQIYPVRADLHGIRLNAEAPGPARQP